MTERTLPKRTKTISAICCQTMPFMAHASVPTMQQCYAEMLAAKFFCRTTLVVTLMKQQMRNYAFILIEIKQEMATKV